MTRSVTLCWLSLLVNVTFFTDGQQGVVKTPEVVKVLLELSGAQNKQLQEKAILVLRNLCFHGASKPVLFVNGKWRQKTSCKLREKIMCSLAFYLVIRALSHPHLTEMRPGTVMGQRGLVPTFKSSGLAGVLKYYRKPWGFFLKVHNKLCLQAEVVTPLILWLKNETCAAHCLSTMARWEFGKLSTSEQNCFYHLIQETIVSKQCP